MEAGRAGETFRSNDGVYRVDWSGLTRIIRSCAPANARVRCAGAMKDNSKLVTELGKRDFWALGLRLPDLYSVDVPNNLIEGKTNEAGCLGSRGQAGSFHPGDCRARIS